MIQNVINKITETQDEFIFQTISDFADRNYDIVVEKEELCKAIELIRMYRENGDNISERWQTATQNEKELSDAYRRGYKQGKEDEHARIMDILDKMGGER